MHLICGEALYDIFVEHGSAGEIGEIAMRAVSGGSPFNVAIGLARLGVSAALATDMAYDGLGERLVARLRSEGVSDEFVRRSAPSTAIAWVTVGPDGAPSYDFAGLGEANYAPDPRMVAAQRSMISNLHLGSIALVLPRSGDALGKLAREMSAQSLVSLDPNVRLSIEPDTARWREAIESTRPFAHVVKVSEEDIALAYGEGHDAEQLCRQWLRDETELVALTRGTAGATLFTRSNPPITIDAIAVSTMDTVGAGDSFMAALLARLAQGGCVSRGEIAGLTAEALAALGLFAAAAAALTCSRRGPALPHLAEVEGLAARYQKAA